MLAGPRTYRTALDQETAAVLRDDMFAVVNSGTGGRAKVSGLRVGGKTGSAEASDDKSIPPHAWFAGFVADDAHPLAVAVVVENGNSGGQVAAPLASKILGRAVSLGL
jgi:peptidoglycan glycosyltransferase